MQSSFEKVLSYFLNNSSLDCLSGYQYIANYKHLHVLLEELLGDWRYAAIINAFLHKGSRELNSHLKTIDLNDNLLNPLIDFSFLLEESLLKLKSTSRRKLLVYLPSCSLKTKNHWINKPVNNIITTEQFLMSSNHPIDESPYIDHIKLIIMPLNESSRAYSLYELLDVIDTKKVEESAIYIPNTPFQIIDVDNNELHLQEIEA